MKGPVRSGLVSFACVFADFFFVLARLVRVKKWYPLKKSIFGRSAVV